MKYFIFACLPFLASCATHYPQKIGYDYFYDYNYEDHKPVAKEIHYHLGLVYDIFYLEDNHVPLLSGSVLSQNFSQTLYQQRYGSHPILTESTISNQPQKGYTRIVVVQLPGGDLLFSSQNNNSQFSVGQDVKILGDGLSHRVIDVE